MSGDSRTSLVRACDHKDVFGVALYPAQRELLAAIDAGPRIHALCLGRRSGKTFMCALVMLHNCLLRQDLAGMVRPGERRYAVAVATNIRQARVVVTAARSIVEASPRLAGMVETVTEDEIRFTNGTALCAFPCSSRGGRGWAISCLVMDEAAFFQSETDGPATADEVWRALSPSVAQFGDAGRIIVSSTPDKGLSGFFYDLHMRASAGGLPEARAHHATTAQMNPTIDEGFLAGEEARDPENFRSEYLAEWVAGGGSFFDLRSVELEDGPAAPGDGRRWLAALDPAFHADQFGVALVGESANERGVLVTGALAGIEPGARRRSLDARREREDATLVAVWERLEPYAEGGGLRVVTDQHQGDSVSSFFGRLGCPVRVVSLTGPLQTMMFTATRARLADGSLRLWRHPQLVEEMRRVRAGKSSESIVLPRVRGSHCDVVSALTLGVYGQRHVTGAAQGKPFGGPSLSATMREAEGLGGAPLVGPRPRARNSIMDMEF